MQYSTWKRISRAKSAARGAANRLGYRGDLASDCTRVGTLRQQIAAVSVYVDAKRTYPEAPPAMLWDFARSAVTGEETETVISNQIPPSHQTKGGWREW